ncbi:MAG: tetratricopeptide repeat protein [candidate division Zixibacteria bacterium]|nr:tetratricopeptide repeat protein [candidate division Zixibacteria bacterium]
MANALQDMTREIAIARDLEKLTGKLQVGGDGDWSKTIRKLLALARNANNDFDYERALNYLSTLESLWETKGHPTWSMDLRFEMLQEKGKAFSAQGKYNLAIDEYQKILGFCLDSDQLPIKAETFTQIGQLLAKQGDYDRALGYVQRAIGANRRLNNDKGTCKALRNLGVIYLELGEFEEAEVNYTQAISIARKIGDKILYADLVNNLGAIMNMKGNWQDALLYYMESLTIYEDNTQVRKSAYTKNNMGISYIELGENDKAFEYFKEAYDTATSIKDGSLTLIVDINLADLYLKKGDLTNAKNHCHKADEYLAEANLVNGHLVEIKRIAGKIAFHEGNYEIAMQFFDESLNISREVGTRFLEAEVLLDRGNLLSAMQQHFDALSDLEASYHIYAQIKAEGKREQAEKVIYSVEELYLEIFDSMAKDVDRKDKYTKGHSDRVASFSLLLARELELPINSLKTIVAAALLHDIGKINIKDDVLKKAGKLSRNEFHHIMKHPEFGVELLHAKEFPWDVKPLILHHHEKLDGTGYPHGLKGENIPFGAKVICIADVFDALTSDRIYRKAFDTERALDIMRDECGITFDPVLFRVFEDMIQKGKADLVINSRTRENEMYSIWSKCMVDNSAEDSSVEFQAETDL